MITRQAIVQLLLAMPEENGPSEDPCCDVNPFLWRVWCAVTSRPDDRSEVWSEADVFESCTLMIDRHLNEVLHKP